MSAALWTLAAMIGWLYAYAGFHVVKDALRRRRISRQIGGQR